ncbi:MAG TPA: hypothetical protein VFG30_43805 [Polyangiales bacterium]|nr:hypothetical protein [Polyangiales bacterium]
MQCEFAELQTCFDPFADLLHLLARSAMNDNVVCVALEGTFGISLFIH